MQCPYCQAEMESGYIQSKSEVVYTNKEKPLLMLPFRKKGDVRLTVNPMAPATAQAWRCRVCRRVMVDYLEWQVQT